MLQVLTAARCRDSGAGRSHDGTLLRSSREFGAGMADLSIAIIGGGIGGIAAALSLLRAGFDAHVYEQAGEVREVGAGIQISPNASRLLHRVGLADPLANSGVKPIARHVRRWQDGLTLQYTPLAAAMETEFGSPLLPDP